MTVERVIFDLAEIGTDLERLVREAPGLITRVFVEVIDMDIGPDTQDEVPVDTGFLQGSWTGAQVVVSEEGRVSIEFGYNAKYAFWVHEIPPPPMKSLSGRSARHRSPQKWKYLEHPVLRHANDPMTNLKEEVDNLFRGGG